MRRVLAVLVVLGVVGCGGHRKGKESPATEPKPERVKRERPEPKEKAKKDTGPTRPTVIVTPASMHDTYRTNELQAREQFLNKSVRLVGVVRTVRVVNSQVHVALGAGSGTGRQVVCKFKDREGLADLSAGEVVVIDGTGDGTVLGSPLVRDCRLRDSGRTEQEFDSLWESWKAKD